MEIIIIDDNLKQDAPLIVRLGMEYKTENIKLFSKSDDGLEYIKNNLIKKLIVILDINFPRGESQGQAVLSEIREYNKLIPVIIWSAKNSTDEDLIPFINNHALYFVKQTSNYAEIMKKVKDAEHKLDLDVATAIENWLNIEDDKNKTIMVSGNNKPLTANEIIKMIRLRTKEGQKIEKSILNLTISLLFRDKESI